MRYAKAGFLLLGLSAALVIPPVGSAAAIPPGPMTFLTAKASPQNGGEPSIAAGPGGWLYVTYPGSTGMDFYRSSDNGVHWTAGAIADPGSGDDTVNVDQSGAVYQGNLNGNLQADSYKSFDHGGHWPIKGKTGSSSDSSNQRFEVDRPWTDAWIPPGKTTREARVYMNYHDFAPSQVWVNASRDGGRTFGSAVDVVSSVDAQIATFCNSSPAGVKVATSGPHAGRIYVAWLAADVATSVATGCNVTQMDTFHTVWIAWSDDEGKTWTDQLVLDAGFGHDAAAFWGDLALDNRGNPYIAFADNLTDEWDIYVMSSPDAGKTWNGHSDGKGAPYRVGANRGTHFFPAIAVGDPGMVDVAYLETPSIVPTLPYGKPQPGGDPNAQWRVGLSQTLDIASASWRQNIVTPKPMHVGDVCTLGLFCLPGISDRNLLDFIDVAIDAAGVAHVSYTDDHDRNCICVSSQISGASVIRRTLTKRQLKLKAKPRVLAVHRTRLAATGLGRPPIVGGLLFLIVAAGTAVLRRRHA